MTKKFEGMTVVDTLSWISETIPQPNALSILAQTTSELMVLFSKVVELLIKSGLVISPKLAAAWVKK